MRPTSRMGKMGKRCAWDRAKGRVRHRRRSRCGSEPESTGSRSLRDRNPEAEDGERWVRHIGGFEDGPDDFAVETRFDARVSRARERVLPPGAVILANGLKEQDGFRIRAQGELAKTGTVDQVRRAAGFTSLGS